MNDALTAVALTLKLATITSVILIIIALPVSWWLANWQHKAKAYLLSLLTLPLVLPPTVLGFYLLVLFSPQSAFGGLWIELTGQQLTFSFVGLVIASLIYSLPFAIQPLYSGFLQFDKRYLDVAKTMGIPRLARLRTILLPLMKAPMVVAFGLSFAHTLGEFGVVLMIGGNIPGETKVISIALYDQVEAMNYTEAHYLAGGLLLFSFALLAILYRFNGSVANASHQR